MDATETIETQAFVFNGAFTIRNRETGDHRTFQVKTQKATARFAPKSRVVSLLTGPDNGTDYFLFGFVNADKIAVWRRYQGLNGKSAYDWYADMLWGLATDPDSEWHKTYDLMIEKRCVRCNRRLTHPTSIETGIGPECAKMAWWGDTRGLPLKPHRRKLTQGDSKYL